MAFSAAESVGAGAVGVLEEVDDGVDATLALLPVPPQEPARTLNATVASAINNNLILLAPFHHSDYGY
jgi:hypothetical protein